MAWSSNPTSDRKARLPSNWGSLREEVLQRCGRRCEVLKKDGSRCRDRATEVDHVIPGDDHRLSNLRGICAWHHARKSAAEGVAARAAARATLTRAPERHPGLLVKPVTPPTNKGF